MLDLGLLCSKSNHGFGRFHGRRNTMIVFLYRPSPQVPHPSEQAAERCYDAAVENVSTQSSQIAKGSVDLTWIFTQALFMALNTILWSLSYPIIRQHHPIEEVKAYLDVALEALNHTSERWPGVQSAVQLYQNLIQGCLKVYDGEALDVVRSSSSAQDETSLLSRTPSCGASSPYPPSLAASHKSRSQGECHGESSVGNQDDAQSPADQDEHFEALEEDQSPAHQTEHFEALEDHQDLQHQFNMKEIQQQDLSHLLQPSFNQQSALPHQTNEFTFPPRFALAQNYGMANFNPNSFMNEFPSTIPARTHLDPNMASDASQMGFTGYLDVEMDTRPWLGSFGDEYSRYTHQAFYPPPERMQSLTGQDQFDLMAALEQDQLPDVSNLMGDAATYYTGNFL